MRAHLAIVLTAAALAVPTHAQGHAPALEGTLVERHGHRLDGTLVDRSFAIRGAAVERRLTDRQPADLIGQRVRSADADPRAAGMQGQVRAAGAARLAPAPALGPRSLLVLLVTTPDAPDTAAEVEAARAAVFASYDSASGFLRAQSREQLSLVGLRRQDGDVVAVSVGVQLAGCPVDELAEAADQGARTGGWSPEAYQHVLYVLPKSDHCRWGGLGEMPGRRAWTNGIVSTWVVAHELGHNLGVHHANALLCSSGDGPAVLSGSCSSNEYGDPFDVMGSGAALMSGWHRASLGQLREPEVTRLVGSATIDLVPVENPAPGGTRVVLVPRKRPGARVQEWLALEARSPSPPFNWFPTLAPVATGVSARIVPALGKSVQTGLLDGRPDTPERTDAPLQPGSVLLDEQHGIRVAVERAPSGVLRLDVSMPQYVDDGPPEPPDRVTGTASTAAVSLSWSEASDDEGLDHYEIERDGAIIAATPALSFTDVQVAHLVQATYRVVAVDTSGNRAASRALRLWLPDVTAPTAPPALRAGANGAAVTLRWGPAVDNRGVYGYRISRDGRWLTTTTSRTLAERPGSGRHRYEVTAVDTAGNVGPAASVHTTVAAASGAAPRIVLSSWSSSYRPRGARMVTLRLRAPRAWRMRAWHEGRIVARSGSGRLVVRVRVPSRRARVRIRVTATGAGGTTSATWTVR